MKKMLFVCCFLIEMGLANAQSYSIDDINKTVFLYTEFYPGKVLFKDKTTQPAAFNYNTLFQQMIYVQNGLLLALDKTATIDTLYVNNRKFVPADTVFYEVRLEDTGFPLYTSYTCEIFKVPPASPYGGTSQTGAVDNLASYRLGVATPYQLRIPENYTVEKRSSFFTRINGQFLPVKNTKQVTALFPANEGQLKNFIKGNHISFNKEADMEKLFLFFGSLK